MRDAKARGLTDPKRLEREVLLYGAENLNVFLGAYATHVGRGKKQLSFEAFLAEHAPYNTEKQLVQYLEKLGIRAEAMETDATRSEMLRWHSALKEWYSEDDFSRGRVKQPVLVEHEAWQLSRVATDHRDGIRSVFVTADGRLRRAAAVINDGELADALLSGVILVKLIDLLLGAKFDHRGLARLIWGVHAMDTDGMLRRYFTDKGLQLRGDIETMVLPRVVDEITREAQTSTKFTTLDLSEDDSVDRAKVSAFLDRFEDQFYELLDDAVHRREEQFDRLLSTKDNSRPEGASDPAQKIGKRSRKR
jgi:hypothetical protein